MAKIRKQNIENGGRKVSRDSNEKGDTTATTVVEAPSGPLKKKLGAKKPALKIVSKHIKKEKKKTARTRLIDPIELINELLKDDSSSDKQRQVNSLQGIKVIKWKLNENSETIHHLFVKKHEVSIAELSKEKPPGRTVLCHNVPAYLYEGHLREIFQTFGNIEKVFIHQNPMTAVPEKYDRLFPSEKDNIRGFRVAYIVCIDKKSVNDIMEMNSEDVDPIALKKPLNVGIPRWINQYNIRVLPTLSLEKSVRKFMDNFDKEEVKRKEMEKNANEPDDDGWVTVTRTGKRSSSGLVRSEAMEERLREKKRRQERQLLNFTPAQVKETKMKQLLELKKKFEEDKQRVALLKQQRKFKPF